VRGFPHVLSIFGHADWSTDTLIRDITKIVEVTADFWGDMPYGRYVFMVHLAPWAGGATEHVNSTIIGGKPDRVATPDGYLGFLSTVAHEYFHTWNVKRLRPKGIVPYDYTRENYLRELWIAEGTTSYYDDLLMVRAGINTPAKYVESRASWVSDDRRKPGNAGQSLSESSFDAWIKFSRSSPHSYNSQTDFYGKGSQVSYLLDMTIRRLTENDKSLDDVMRLMYRRFPSTGPGYTVDDMQAAASEVAGPDLSGFFEKYVHGTEPLMWEEAFSTVGILLTAKDSTGKPWIGVSTRESGGRTTVSTVVDGSPGRDAGLDAGDEIVALDGKKSNGDGLKKIVSAKKPGDIIKIAIFRDDRLREAGIVVRESPVPDYRTEKVSEPTKLQKKSYENWLGSSWE
ncbi:MAG TPA: PDZ domain-containing protein, partial [Bacteroidota bacterium]|nr:PDZ domain-containing protein [Bacteroidota bacterium]